MKKLKANKVIVRKPSEREIEEKRMEEPEQEWKSSIHKPKPTFTNQMAYWNKQRVGTFKKNRTSFMQPTFSSKKKDETLLWYDHTVTPDSKMNKSF